MPLSWNEIRSRAHAFSRKWANEESERAEAQSFWNDFFIVFGIERKRVAIFEKQVSIARAAFPDASLADLYDPLTMPPALVKAHQKLDAAMDAAYGKKGFKNDAERVAFLFERYQALTSLLPSVKKPARRTLKTARRSTPAE